jgi:hypothetical protein
MMKFTATSQLEDRESGVLMNMVSLAPLLILGAIQSSNRYIIQEGRQLAEFDVPGATTPYKLN